MTRELSVVGDTGQAVSVFEKNTGSWLSFMISAEGVTLYLLEDFPLVVLLLDLLCLNLQTYFPP